MAKKIKMDADVAIIGGGPGGCTLAKELSKKGKKIVLFEKGSDSDRMIGNGLGVMMRLEKGFHFPMPLKKTKEGDTLILSKCLGGGTVLYAGSASKPSLEYWKEYGIDLPKEMIDEAEKECWVNMPPEEFIGPGTRRVWEAANDVGVPFEKQLRHVDFDRCKPGCPYCSNGCRKNAKWTAREYAKEAVNSGATILTNTEAKGLIIENNTAGGVRAKGKGGKHYEVNAKVVVCSAGGTHTSRLLKKSGFPEAGSTFCGDPTFFTFGFVKDGPGNGFDHGMTAGWYDEENKVLFCSMVMPYMGWHMNFLQDEHIKSIPKLGRYNSVLGVFAKITDEGVGQVYANGSISKTFIEEDHKRFAYSREINEKILKKAGCDPDDLHHSGYVMGHPSSTVRVGKLLDTNLETSVKNLYCCDTSVFPKALGMPPAMTIVVLAKRLAKHLESIV